MLNYKNIHNYYPQALNQIRANKEVNDRGNVQPERLLGKQADERSEAGFEIHPACPDWGNLEYPLNPHRPSPVHPVLGKEFDYRPPTANPTTTWTGKIFECTQNMLYSDKNGRFLIQKYCKVNVRT